MWWMSVNNYIRPKKLKDVYNQFGLKTCMSEIRNRITIPNYRCFPLSKMSRVEMHLLQSEYARLFLAENGITNVEFLTDYINDTYIEEAQNVDISKKENIVIFNPAKGRKFTKKIIKHCKEIEFVPIKGMTNDQVVNLMSRAKVYIDFGNHPGKDRIPREAATLKCCILTSKNGSAANNVDVCIPQQFKYDSRIENISEIKKMIINQI